MPVVPADWVTFAKSLLSDDEISSRSASFRRSHRCRTLLECFEYVGVTLPGRFPCSTCHPCSPSSYSKRDFPRLCRFGTVSYSKPTAFIRLRIDCQPADILRR